MKPVSAQTALCHARHLDEVIKLRNEVATCPSSQPGPAPRSGIIFGRITFLRLLETPRKQPGTDHGEITPTALPFLVFDPKLYWHAQLSGGDGGRRGSFGLGSGNDQTCRWFSGHGGK